MLGAVLGSTRSCPVRVPAQALRPREVCPAASTVIVPSTASELYSRVSRGCAGMGVRGQLRMRER